jgi:indolepyruvate ferredoxin oxidoreductase beta subunit
MKIMNDLNVYNIIIAGIGGQGIISATDIIAQCAMNHGFEVRSYGDYGMARRGGAVSAHIRIGMGSKVYLPFVTEGNCDLLIGTELIETIRNSFLLKKNGTIITNTQIVHPAGDIKRKDALNSTKLFKFLNSNFENCLLIDGTELAKKVGQMHLNMLMLGAGCAANGFPLKVERVKGCIKNVFHPREDSNLKAFDIGYEKIKNNTKKT